MNVRASLPEGGEDFVVSAKEAPMSLGRIEVVGADGEVGGDDFKKRLNLEFSVWSKEVRLSLDHDDVFLLTGARLIVKCSVALLEAPGQWVDPTVVRGGGEVDPWPSPGW